MHYTVRTDVGHVAMRLTRRVRMPDIPDGLERLKKLGRCNISSVRQICDYMGVSPSEFLCYLINKEGAIEAYRTACIDLKIYALDNMIDVALSDATEKTISTIQRAWEFINHNFARNTLDSDRLKIQRAEAASKSEISRELLKVSKKKLQLDRASLGLRKDESFIRLVTEKDEETLKKIQRHITPVSDQS